METPQGTGVLPTIVPISPTIKKEPFDDPAFQFEVKYDGFRGVLHFSPTRRRIVSKSARLLYRFDALADRIAEELPVERAILDGEVIVKGPDGRPDFKSLLRQQGTPTYVAFDLLWLMDTDLRDFPLADRRKLLEELLRKKSAVIEPSIRVRGRGIKLFEEVRKNKLEGIVAKRLAGQYHRRLAGWYKIKNPEYPHTKGRQKFFDAIRKKT